MKGLFFRAVGFDCAQPTAPALSPRHLRSAHGTCAAYGTCAAHGTCAAYGICSAYGTRKAVD